MFNRKSMDASITCMDKSITKLPVYRETRFRTPSQYERWSGLWIDRIGSAQDAHKPIAGLRILGQYVVVAVESGKGVLVTRKNGTHDIQAGDVFLLIPDEPASYGPYKKWLSRWIVWDGPLARQHAELAGLDHANPIYHQTAHIVHQAFFTLIKLMDIEDKAAVLERQAVILNMLAGLLRAQRSAAYLRRSGPDWDSVVQHVRRHLNSRLTLAELAAVSRLSVPHFRRMFRRHIGRSPVEFILSERVSRAKDLLVRGASIKQTARETGFADQFYFMRVFKKVTGQTAGEFAGGVQRTKNYVKSRLGARNNCR